MPVDPGPHVEVEALLRRLAGADARVVGSDLLAEHRGRVERLTMDPPIDGVGATVIVKRRALGEYTDVNLAVETVALEAIGRAELDIAPRLLGTSDRGGSIVMSDVGSRSVENDLFGTDAATAEASLVSLAATLGTLHQITLTRPLLDDVEPWTIGMHAIEFAEIVQFVDELALPPATKASTDVESVLETLRAPGHFGVLAHGDVTPNNAVIGEDGRCRLVDFEGAAYQHLGVDACMLRFPFAWYGRWATVPPSIQVTMEQAYRDVLGRDDAEVDLAIAVGCAAMCLVRLHRLARIADPAQESGPTVRRRTQIVTTVDTTIEAVDRAEILPALASWLRDLNDAMRERWTEARLIPASFPAFA